MAFDQATLPRDPDRLIEIIVDLQDRNSHLLAVVATLRRAVFGPRSEKLLVVDRAQLRLELNDVSDVPAAANDDSVALPARLRAPRPKAARNIGALPKHLPRCEIVG